MNNMKASGEFRYRSCRSATDSLSPGAGVVVLTSAHIHLLVGNGETAAATNPPAATVRDGISCGETRCEVTFMCSVDDHAIAPLVR